MGVWHRRQPARATPRRHDRRRRLAALAWARGCAWAEAAAALLFPPRCAGCGRPGGGLCAACRAAVPALPDRRCAVCGDPALEARGRCAACLARPPAFARALAIGRYAPPLSRCVQALKYHRRSDAARDLAELLAAALPASLARRVDAVVPVPSHASRVRERGIDHAAELARALAVAIDRPLLGALARIRPTATQVGTSAATRRANVAGAFEALATVDGLCLLLVDDVLTTGATAGACAEALRAAGARRVWVATAARAAGPVAAAAGRRYNPPPPARKEIRHGDRAQVP